MKCTKSDPNLETNAGESQQEKNKNTHGTTDGWRTETTLVAQPEADLRRSLRGTITNSNPQHTSQARRKWNVRHSAGDANREWRSTVVATRPE